MNKFLSTLTEGFSKYGLDDDDDYMTYLDLYNVDPDDIEDFDTDALLDEPEEEKDFSYIDLDDEDVEELTELFGFGKNKKQQTQKVARKPGFEDKGNYAVSEKDGFGNWGVVKEWSGISKEFAQQLVDGQRDPDKFKIINLEYESLNEKNDLGDGLFYDSKTDKFIRESLSEDLLEKISAEDKADSDALRAIYKKSPSKLTKAEKELLDKYGLDYSPNWRSPKALLKSTDSGRYIYAENPKVNLADQARKRKVRPEYSHRTIRGDRAEQNREMHKDYRDFKDARHAEKYGQENALYFDQEYLDRLDNGAHESSVARALDMRDWEIDRWQDALDTKERIKSKYKKDESLSEDLSENDMINFNSDFYHALEKLAYKYKKKGISQDDFYSAWDFFDIHFFDDGMFNEILDESLNEEDEISEADCKKAVDSLLNDF